MAVDVKKWLEEKAAEIGLDETEKSIAAKLVNSDRFKSDFVGLPDFHSALDKQKRTFQQQVETVTNLNAQWQDEYENTYAPALDAVKKLQTQGLDMTNFQANVTQPKGLSADDIKRMIQEHVEPIRAGTLDFGTFVADKAIEYNQEYGKRFKAADFRTFAYENRGDYPTLPSAYDAFTAKEREEKKKADDDKWRADETARIRLEVQSQAHLPESGAEGSPLFAANDVVDNKKEEPSRDANRQAFAKLFPDIGKISI